MSTNLNNKILTFKKINIIKAPGFINKGLKIDNFIPQINIIYGPNAAGKTTTARSFSYLLWPGNKVPLQAIVSGEFTIGNTDWFVELDSGQVKYQKNGFNSLPPSLPPAEHRDRYYIALHDLLQKDTGDENLAEVIIRESAGGYQISDSVEELGLKDKASKKGKTTREATKRINEYRQKIQEQKELLAEERKLEGLSDELEKINRARQKLNIVKQAVEYAEADRDYRIEKNKYEQFPVLMEKMNGDEIDRLEEIENEINISGQKKKKAEEKAASARKILIDVDLPEKGIKDSFFTEIKNKKEKLKSAEEKINTLKSDISEAEVKRKEEEKYFVNLVNEDKLEKIDGPAYNELSDFARRAEEIDTRLSALESLKKFLFSDSDTKITERRVIIEDGIRCLEKWLSSPVSDKKVEKKTRNISLFSGILIAIITIYLGYSVDPHFYLLVIIPPLLFWYGFGRQNKERDYREEAREEFVQLGLALPAEWEGTVVKQYLRELRDLLADMQLYTSKKNYWQDISSEYNELKKKQQEIKEKREKLIVRFGTAPDSREQTLYFFSNRLSRWQDAHNRLTALRDKRKQAENYYKKLKNDINNMLADYDYPFAEDAAKISGQITDLEERNSKHREAIRDLKEAEEAIQEAEGKIKETVNQKNEMLTFLDLDEDNARERLQGLCEQYERYIEIKEKLSNLEHQRNVEKMKLAEYSNFAPELLKKDLTELKEEKDRLQNKAENYERVLEEISYIKSKIDTAREKSDIEEAFSNKERALEELQAEIEDDYEKVAGRVLADFINEINLDQNRPLVFNRAREIFSTITRGNYRLEVNNSNPPVFRAVDTVEGRGKSLAELSSGTRIQLLMSVRMAFIDREEEGLTLPLYLDETLANSDDRRAEAIIEAVVELARAGRQCFYFTARQDEVQKWASMLSTEPEIEYNLVNLGEEAINIKKTDAIDLTGMDKIFSTHKQIPETGDLSHREYGEKISVSPFIPRRGAGSVHIWYIVEDTELIKFLLEMGISTWGQLKTLLATGKDTFLPAEKRALITEIKELGHCLEEFVDNWQVGRGSPVDRAALMATDAVTDNFIDEVAQLAEEVNGRAEVILDKLRRGSVARFRTEKIAELEEYFLEEGYLASAGKLSDEQIFVRMLASINSDKLKQSGEKVKRLLKRLSYFEKDSKYSC